MFALLMEPDAMIQVSMDTVKQLYCYNLIEVRL